MHEFQKNDRVIFMKDLTMFGSVTVAKHTVGVVKSSMSTYSLCTVEAIVATTHKKDIFRVPVTILKLVEDRKEDDYTVAKHKAEMLDSYLYAILECGGSPTKFIEDIDKMTVKEMIDVLAQNGVRFTTVKKENPKSLFNREVEDDDEF